MLQSNQKIIRHKVGFLNLAEELGNVSKACQMMGLSRDTFYRYRDAVEEGGVEALLEKPRRVPNMKNRIDIETENAVVDFAVEYPAYGQVRVSNELRKLGVFVSASGVRSIWLRHDLANFKQRLKALEPGVIIIKNLTFGGIVGVGELRCTTMIAPIRAKCVKAERPCRPWRMAKKEKGRLHGRSDTTLSQIEGTTHFRP